MAQPLYGADGFAGVWIYSEPGFTSTATIRVQQNALSGTVVEEGVTYRFSGTQNGMLGQITLLYEGEQIPVRLQLNGNKLLASVDGDQVVYVRQQAAVVAEPIAAKPLPQAEQNNPQQAVGGANLGHIILERKVLHDAGVRNMPSHTLLVPKGWQVKGGAWWANPNYFKVLPSQNIQVVGPNDVELNIAMHIAAFDYLPSAQALQLGTTRPREGASNNGYPVIHFPTTDAEWHQRMKQGIQQAYPDATNIRVDEVVVIPQLTAMLQQRLAPLKAQQQAGSFCEGAVFAASMRYNSGGKEFEQLNVFGITNIGFNSEFGRNLYWGMEPNISYRAPSGKLEAALPLLLTIANSLGHTPEWVRMVNDHARKINMQPSFKPSILHDAGKSVGDIMFEGWKNREAITSPSQRRVVESIHGVNTYSTGSGSVQLPTGYNKVYSNGLGDYVLSNDAFYQPATDPSLNNQTWTALNKFHNGIIICLVDRDQKQ